MSTSTLPARVSERTAPLELRFVKNQDELLSAARNGIAAGARRIRIEPPEAATAFISALAPDANSGLQFLSSAGVEQALPLPLTAATTPDPAVDLVVIAVSDPAAIDTALMSCLDLKTGVVLALLTDRHWTRRPLFLISIPKAGTHLLRCLAEGFGYKRARICPPLPVGGSWYCIEGAQPHTSARQFFFSDAARDHPFLQSPALFIYRDPRDILVSEAYWYSRDEALHLLKGYFDHLSLRERLLRSVDDPFCVGTIRDRVAEYAAWLDLPNVVPLSFEELVGSAGNGDDGEQHRAVWSVQLKLQVDGRPADFASPLFDRSSPTFYRGQIGAWREHFDDEVKQRFEGLPQDFMHRYGYDPHGRAEQFPSHREHYRRRTLEIHEVVAIDTPYLVEADVNGFNIVRFRRRYYAVPQHGPKGNLRTFTDAELSALPSDPELASLRAKLEWTLNSPLLARAMEQIGALQRRVSVLEQARDIRPK